MSSTKTFSKGQFIFKKGDKISSLYLIESGQVSLGLQKGKNYFEFYTVTKTNVLGELGLFGVIQHKVSAMAQNEVKVIEVPIEFFQAQLEALNPGFKAVLKSVGERLKISLNDLFNYKSERDPTPLPASQVPKAFGSLFHAAIHLGEKKDNKVTVDWKQFKTYIQRVFMEDPKRLEQTVNLLVKMKLATLEYMKLTEEPDAPEELATVHFTDIQLVEHFFEFHQHYSNKAGRQEVLKIDNTSYAIVEGILKTSREMQPDRTGTVRMDYKVLLAHMKDEGGVVLNNDHFALLEQRGLFVTRKANDAGETFLSFNAQEFRVAFQNWKFLIEVEKWNENGFVDMKEPVTLKTKAAEGMMKCPTCNGDVPLKQNFCGHCGAKVAA